MKRLLKRLARMSRFTENTPQPLVRIEISSSALHNNLNEFKNIALSRKVAPVLKSNAYGHGLSIVANELKNEKVPFFVIDSYFEAKALRNEGIKIPLLIIGYSSIESIVKNHLKDISFTISNIESLKELSTNIKNTTKIHLKIDTGMHRHGISIEEKNEAIKTIKKRKEIVLEGICSHFSDADGIDQTFTNKQIDNWNNVIKFFKNQFSSLKYWHISNSAGHIFNKAEANMTRLGIGLYGLTNVENLNLKPVLEMKTIITGVKKINKGQAVGYNNTYIAENDMTIATIPVGYNEGLDRRLSNKGFVKVADIECPIIGRISMNITIINVSEVREVKMGDEAIVFSSNKNDSNSIENVAKICETISYEIAVHIPQHLKRTLIK